MDADPPQAVIAPDGTALVAWVQGRQLRGAIRRAGAAAFEPLAAPISEISKEPMELRPRRRRRGRRHRRLAALPHQAPGHRGRPAVRRPERVHRAAAALRRRRARLLARGRRQPGGRRDDRLRGARARGRHPRRHVAGRLRRPGRPPGAVGPGRRARRARRGRRRGGRRDRRLGARRARQAAGGGVDTYVEDNIEAASRPADALSFGPRVPVTPAGIAAQGPRVAVGGTGETTVAYRTFDGANYVAAIVDPPARRRGVRRAAPAVGARRERERPRAGRRPAGRRDDRLGARRGSCRSRRSTRAGPLLEELTVPETAEPGQPITVSVNARDARSARPR